MKLEFELEVLKKGKDSISYTLLRKGLPVGIIFLKKPYNEKYGIKKNLIMCNRMEG